jgi:integrase
MSDNINLDRQVDTYLAVREAVGLSNRGQDRRLRDFVAYVRSTGGSDDAPIRAATAISWAWDNAPATCGVRGRADRLMMVRGFLSYLSAVIPGTDVPAQRIIAAGRRRRPYIFSDDELTTLIGAAACQKSRVPFRPIVHSTLLGLLASTGLRVAEAGRLRMIDVRLADDHPHLQVVETKFQKSRIVPLHSTVAAALDSYLEQRRPYADNGWGDRLFVNRDGRPLAIHALGHWFAQLARGLGIAPAGGQERRPCLTSFRHTFAVRRLREWYKAGCDVQPLLPTLAVYLGHVGPESSYWYLSATPDLLRAAGARFTLGNAGGEP